MKNDKMEHHEDENYYNGKEATRGTEASLVANRALTGSGS